MTVTARGMAALTEAERGAALIHALSFSFIEENDSDIDDESVKAVDITHDTETNASDGDESNVMEREHQDQELEEQKEEQGQDDDIKWLKDYIPEEKKINVKYPMEVDNSTSKEEECKDELGDNKPEESMSPDKANSCPCLKVDTASNTDRTLFKSFRLIGKVFFVCLVWWASTTTVGVTRMPEQMRPADDILRSLEASFIDKFGLNVTSLPLSQADHSVPFPKNEEDILLRIQRSMRQATCDGNDTHYGRSMPFFQYIRDRLWRRGPPEDKTNES